MKKTIVAVAALAFALGAFADGVPSVSWFTATPGNLDDGAWTLTPTATEPLVEDNVWVVDTETPGEDDAIYTPKVLKADKKTRVALNIAFGAAYAATELPDEPTDAQTGLVLGIDEGVTNFYGLVSGGWKKLTGGVPADLDTAVDVTVEIDYEANPVTLSFKVGNAVLADAADPTVTTFERYAGTDATSLASVGFAGSGKIASIAGDADPKYVVGSTGYLAFADAVTAAAGTSVIELYYDTTYAFSGNSVLKVKPTGAYTFTPNYGSAFHTDATDKGVTTYTVKNTATFSGGDGSVSSPYIIANATDFAELAHFATTDDFSSSKYFLQNSDISVEIAIPKFAGIYGANGKQLSSTADAIFTTANGATFNDIAFSGALIGTAESVTSTGCTMTADGVGKPVTNGSVAGLTFATLANGVYTFCATPSVAGMYYVMLDSEAAITFGTEVGDELTLTAVAEAAYTGTVGTEVGQAKVVKDESTYTVAWDTIEITLENPTNGSVDTVEATGSGVNPTSEGNVWTVVRGDTVTVTYAADPGYVFSGKTTTADVVLENVNVNPTIILPAFTEGKAKYAGDLYDTVQNAVTAAEGQSAAAVEVVKSAEETVTIPENTGIYLTTADGAKLTGSISPLDQFALRAGTYDFGEGFLDYASVCDKGFWPTAGEGSVVTVAAGEPEIPATEDMPAQNLPKNFFAGAKLNDGTPVESAEQKVAYLEEIPTVEQDQTSNGLKRWQNEALGLLPTQPVPVVAPQTEGATIQVSLDAVVPSSSGLTVSYKVGDSDQALSEVTFDLKDEEDQTGITPIKIVLTDANGKAVEVKEVKLGVMQKKAQKSFDMVPVAWSSIDGTPITVANLIKTANLTEGDEMHVYDRNLGGYVSWQLNASKAWGRIAGRGEAEKGATEPGAYQLTKGQAVWLDRQDATVPIYTYGGASEETGAVELAEGMTLVANPKVEAVKIVDLITGAADGDQIIINENTYTFDGSAWTYVVTTTTEQTVRGKVRKVTMTENKTVVDETLPAGQGFWYSAKGNDAKVNW